MEPSTAAKISSGSRTRQGRAGQSRRYPGEVALGSKADPGKTWDHFGFTVGSKQDFSHSIPSSSALGHEPKCSMWAKHDRSTPESGPHVAARHISGVPSTFDMRAGHTGAMGHRVVIQPSNFGALDHALRLTDQGVVRHQIDAAEKAARRAPGKTTVESSTAFSGSYDREHHGAISRVAAFDSSAACRMGFTSDGSGRGRLPGSPPVR